ncbi:hypothetical protein BaRGS_00010356, partial [Batillaria attramentaria]
ESLGTQHDGYKLAGKIMKEVAMGERGSPRLPALLGRAVVTDPRLPALGLFRPRKRPFPAWR